MKIQIIIPSDLSEKLKEQKHFRKSNAYLTGWVSVPGIPFLLYAEQPKELTYYRSFTK